MPLDPKTADLMLTDFSAWENTLDDNQRQQLETTFKYEPDRVAAQKRFASVAFVAANTGQNVEEISRRFEDYYMHAYARDEKGLGIVSGVKDTNEFHGLLIKRANDNIVKAEKVNQARLTGRESGLFGASMPSELSRFQTAYPDATEDEKLAFADTLFQASVKALPYRKLAKEASSKLSKEMESNIPSTGTFQDVASQLLSVPENDRPMVISMIGASGGATAKERSAYLSKLAGAMGRMTETVAASSLNMASDAVLYGLLSPLEGQEQDTVMPTTSDDEFRILTQQIRQMADAEIAPIKGDGWWSQTGIDVARMAPQIAVTLANPAIGMAANTAYFRDTVAAQAKSEDPSLSYKQAAAIGDISAPFNAAIETVTALIPFGKIKMPFFQKWLSTATTTIAGTARKFVVRGAFGVASEVSEEMAQAVIPLWTQDALAALNKDNSGVDWEKRMPDFSQIAQQTWGPALVFGIVGGGVVSIKDIKNGRALASDVDMMVATGINPETAVKIKAASDIQDYNTADTLFREEFVSDAKASKPDIEAATERLKARFKAQENVESLTKLTSPEYTASVTRAPSGWQVTTGEGTVIPVESAEAARRIAVDLRQVGSQEEADTLVGVIDSYYEQGKQAETVFTGEDVQASKELGVVGIRRDAGNAVISQRQFGPKALETVREEAEVAGIKSNTRGVFAHINGSNEIFPMRVADGAKEIVRRMNLYKSQAEGQPQVITFLHENFESTWQLGMANGTFSEQETRTAMRALLPAFEGVTALNTEEAQFINNLRTLASGKGNETMLRETVSEMVIRDVLGRDRQGRATGMKPGSISRAIEASVMGANTQEEASALKSILAAIKAFTAYLKGVFGTVDAMIKANEEGKIGAEYDTFINKVLGIDEVKQMESQTVDEVKAMLGIDEEVQAVIDAGNMAFSTSRAQPADTSNVTEMPDGAQLVGPTTFSIEAYHGTPHEVDRFRMANIGTGEGKQAFGWGLYFAKARKVAEGYRSKLTERDFIRKVREVFSEFDTSQDAINALDDLDLSDGQRNLVKALEADDWLGFDYPHQAVQAALREPENFDLSPESLNALASFGNLYTVELLPDEEEFLDWDKPLSEQSEKVQAAVAKMWQDWIDQSPLTLENEATQEQVDAIQNSRGSDFYGSLAEDDSAETDEGNIKAASEKLLSLGIPGIRYLDGGSRAAGEGTSNYVIFDENLVKIIEKNGQKVETDPGPEVEQGAPAPAPDWDLFDPSKQDSDSQTIKWKETSFSISAYDPKALPPLTQKIYDEISQSTDSIYAVWIDRMKVGNYKGIPLQGGMHFPTIKKNLKKRVVWAYNAKQIASAEMNKAAKTGGYMKLILMQEGNIIGNKHFTLCWFNDLRENIEAKLLTEEKALQELNRVRKLYAEETKHSKEWETLEEAQDTIINMGQIDRGKTYFQKGKLKAKKSDPNSVERISYKSLLTQKMTAQGFPDAVAMVNELEESDFKGLPIGTMVAIIQIDPNQKPQTAQEAGVPAHLSYGFVLKGRPVARIVKYQSVKNIYPEVPDYPMNWSTRPLSIASGIGQTFSISPAQDAEYLDLAKNPEKNRTLLQKMVDAAAKAAGFTVGPVWHGSNSPFNIFDKKKAKEGRFGKGFYFTPDEASAKNYGNESVRVRGGELTLRQFYLKGDTFNYKDAIRVAFDPSQIKSADPITYDDAGNVIPLSQRFNEATPDIRFSISPVRNLNELSDQVEKQFAENPVGALEVKSRMIRQFTKIADKWSNERWTPQGNKIRPISEKRTVKSLDKEQAMRQARALDEILANQGFTSADAMKSKDAKDYEAWQRFQESKDLLLSGGMTDEEAQKLAGASASTWRKNFVNAIREATKKAKAEAQAWRDETDAMQKEDWSPKESLVRDLITLEAIRAVFPQEIRGKIGGFVALARKASESARLKVLQKQLERGQVLLEKHLKEQYGTATEELLKRFKSQKDASGRITGKIISTATEQIDYAAEFIKLSIEEQADRQAALEKKVEESEDANEVQDALTKLGIARLFDMWSDKDSAARESAFNWLNDTIEAGKLGKSIMDEARKEMLTEMRQSAQSSILQGDELNPDIADNITNLNKGVFKRALLNLRGMLSEALWTTIQRLELIFGEDSKIVNHFAEKIINAANLSTDIKRLVEAQKKDALSIIFNSDSKYAHARGIAELQKMKKSGISTRRVKKEEIKLDLETLTKLNDGTMTAEAAGLRQDEVDAALEEFATNARKSTVTIERVVNAGTPVERMMSETQGIQWWLWSMQDASRKQMERDGWDADSFKQLEEFLSPEAKALGRWISGNYQDAAGMIDPIYRKLFNAPLPRTKNYSPIHRRNMNTGGDIMDIDGSDMNSGLAAGFTKARVNTTASLVEMDALAVFLAHWENVSHWVSHAELMRDMKAVLLDKDTAVAIRQKKSEGYLQRLKDDVKTIEKNGTNSANELVNISRVWRWFMQYRSYKGLAFRLSPIIKQTPALLNPLLADVPAHNYMMGMARAFIEPQTFAKEVSAMWTSDIIRRRIESGFSAESRVAMQGAGMTGSQAIVAMQAGMVPMGMVDGGWTALGAAISFDYYRRGYMRDNPQMTPEIADAKAIARVEKMIATSAQPSDIYARSLSERSGNPFMKSMSMFVSDQRKALAIELMAIRRLATGKSKNVTLDIQRAVVAHVVQAGVSQVMAVVIASLLGDDEDRDRELSSEQWALALGLGPVNGLFVFGRLIDKIGRGLLGLRVFPADDLASKVANDLLKGGKNMDDLFNPDDSDDFMDALDSASTAVGAGMSAAIGPVGGVIDVGANVAREARKIAKRLADQ